MEQASPVQNHTVLGPPQWLLPGPAILGAGRRSVPLPKGFVTTDKEKTIELLPGPLSVGLPDSGRQRKGGKNKSRKKASSGRQASQKAGQEAGAKDAGTHPQKGPWTLGHSGKCREPEGTGDRPLLSHCPLLPVWNACPRLGSLLLTIFPAGAGGVQSGGNAT